MQARRLKRKIPGNLISNSQSIYSSIVRRMQLIYLSFRILLNHIQADAASGKLIPSFMELFVNELSFRVIFKNLLVSFF